MSRPPQIVAMGGGGFSEELGNTLLDDFVLGLAGVERPRVCFVPTASGDAVAYIAKFYAAFTLERCQPSHLPLLGPTGERIIEKLLAQDVIYVGGGSTVNMLAVWRAHGVDTVLREVWESGVVLCGLSAGRSAGSRPGSRTHSGAGRSQSAISLAFCRAATAHTGIPSRSGSLRIRRPLRRAALLRALPLTTVRRSISLGPVFAKPSPPDRARGRSRSASTGRRRCQRGCLASGRPEPLGLSVGSQSTGRLRWSQPRQFVA